MPKYRVRDPRSGRTVVLTGDAPPTEQELHQIFASLGEQGPPQPRSMVGRLMESAAQGQQAEADAANATRAELPDLAIGGAKGAANTAIGLGQAMDRYLPGVRQVNTALYGPLPENTFQAAREQFATPTNPTQQVGFAAEQAAEFFALPAAKGGLASRAVTEGAQQGALAGAQGGNARSVALSALPGAAVPMAGRAAGAVKPDSAERMNKALAATTRENKARSARVAPEMVRRGVYARDLPALEAMASHESAKAGQAVGDTIGAVASKEVDVLPLVEALEQAKASAVDVNAAGRRVVIEPDQVRAIENLQTTLMDYGDTISIASLNKVRLKWDEVVQASKGFTNPDVGWKAWAAREGRSILRDELGKTSPDIDRVMAEYAFWQNIEDVAHATNQRRVGQSGGLLPTIAGGAGAVVMEAAMPGSGAAMKIGAGALGAKLAANLKRLLESPGYQMWSAVQKQRLADALASGNPERVASAVGRGLAFATSQAVRPAPSH